MYIQEAEGNDDEEEEEEEEAGKDEVDEEETGRLGIKNLCTYSLSRKTMNTRENFWNVYCFTTNQKRDETAEDNHQTAAWKVTT